MYVLFSLQIFLLALFACATLARPQEDLDTFNEELLDRLGPVNVSNVSYFLDQSFLTFNFYLLPQTQSGFKKNLEQSGFIVSGQ